jgi:hypothetical protein
MRSNGNIATTPSFDNPFSRRRVPRQLVGGASRPDHQLAATVWTYALQDLPRAAPAKGAFKRANECVRGLRRKIAIAAFAIWSKLKHSADSNAA